MQGVRSARITISDIAPGPPILNHDTRSMITQIPQLDQNITEHCISCASVSCCYSKKNKNSIFFFRNLGEFLFKTND